ncbi:MAG: hypothetical protein HFI34_09945 [Lachnospiraceae bacterium]|nr:hypothetical protein [Lachnospiraceae bacterium]
MAIWYYDSSKTDSLGEKTCAYIDGFGWVIIHCVGEKGTLYTIESYCGDVLGTADSLEAAKQWVKENIEELEK